MALALVVAGCGSPEPSPDLTLPRDPASVAAGMVLYESNCAQCHGADLTGGRGPGLWDKTALDDAALAETMERGRGLGMPSFGNELSDDEIASIVDYIRSIQLERGDG